MHTDRSLAYASLGILCAVAVAAYHFAGYLIRFVVRGMRWVASRVLSTLERA